MSEGKNTSPAVEPALLRLWRELRRRKVVRVASVYLVTGWLVVEVASTTFDSFGIPEWAFRFVTLLVLLGFPIALVLAWAFELTPQGIKTTSSAATASSASPPPASLARKRNWHAYALGALLPTVIFGAVALFFYIQMAGPGGQGQDSASPAADQASTAAQSIAMMPLVNMSSLEENAHFAGGIHEDVLTQLSGIDNLQIISRTSMLRYAASDLTLREIGRELGVDYIVEGSVRRIGNHVRVTVQLINAASDVHVWASNFERELVDVFATQSELAREISDSIHLELQPESVGALEGMPTRSVKAYDSYIRAQSIEKTEGENEASMVRRRQMLEQAVAADPNFVQAWGDLKRLYDLQLARMKQRGWYLSEGQSEEKAEADLLARSQRAMQKAIALDPDNEETLLAQAVDYSWPKSRDEMRAQRAIFDRILAANPDSAKGWYHLGHWYSHRVDLPGEDVAAAHESAMAAFDRALELDPFNGRMVAAVLKWHRDRGYEQDLPRLAERLRQILPETAADRSLARVSWRFRRSQLRSAFLATADESLFEDYAAGLAEALASGDFDSASVFRLWDELDLRIFTNDLDGLIELSRRSLKDGSGHERRLVLSNVLNHGAMAARKIRGELGEARELALAMVANEDAVLDTPEMYDRSVHISFLADAHLLLGNSDAVHRLADVLLEGRGEQPVLQGWEVSTVARGDLESEVQLAFAQLARNPGWSGFDVAAAYHVYNRRFLAHPRVMEYYLQKGKWVDYLAARVPEYADYSR